MKIFKHDTASVNWGEQKTRNMYNKVNHAAQGSDYLIRLSGPFVAVASSSIRLASRVAALGEIAFKGLKETLGSAVSPNQYSFKKGISLLTRGLGERTADLLFTPFHFGVGAVATTFGILLNPGRYSLYREEAHSPEIVPAN